QRAPRVETSCARIGDDQTFGFLRVSKELWPLGLQEAEVVHLQLSSEGAVLKDREEGTKLSQRGAVFGLDAAHEAALQFDGWQRNGHGSNNAHIQPRHDRAFGGLIQIPPRERMSEEISVNENRQALLFVERDATEVLRVNGKRHVVWNDRAPSACTHYCYQHVARPDGVPLQFSILRMGNESEFVPAKFICDSVIEERRLELGV